MTEMTRGFKNATPPRTSESSPGTVGTAIAGAAANLTYDKLISNMSERLVLCAVLTEGRETLASNVASVLAPDDFGEEIHQNFYSVWRQLSEAGVARDLTALLDAGARRNMFLGGEDFAVALVTDATLLTATDAAINAAAGRVKELSVTRTMAASALRIAVQAASGLHTIDDLTSMLEDAAVNARTTSKSSRSGFEHISRFQDVILESLEARLTGVNVESATTSGFPGLDRLLQGGFMDEDLVILAARPSMGKTALLINFLDAAAISGRTVGLWSLEMRGAAIAKRELQRRGRINGRSFVEREEIERNMDRIVEAMNAVSALPFYIDETPGISLAEIRARGRLLKAQHEKIILAVDYMQLVAASASAKPGTDTRTIVSETSRGLKALARELKCPVIALSQLSRQLEQRANKRPMMSDLRESGQIEQDADVIIFAYRDEVYNTDTKEPGVTELIIAKQRDGETGTLKVQHQLASMTYEEFFV